jgi:hypothetical protein
MRRLLGLLVALVGLSASSESAHDTRVSMVYMPSIPISGSELKYGAVNHHLGLEVSAGGELRYHLAAYYGTLSGFSSVRLEPAALGIPIRLYSGDRTVIELEPVLSIINAELLFADPARLLTLSTSIRVQFNIVIDHFYLGITPFGLDGRYYGLAWGNGRSASAHELALDYRPQVFIGASF